MEFIKLIDELKEAYSDDCIVRKNGTVLLHPGRIPNCRHMLFKPLTQDIIDEHLVSQYRNAFPAEYISLLKHTNGANLFTVRIKMDEFALAHSMLTIFGLPLRPPYSRPDGEEPFDIRIEDLGRHKDIPRSWLKCGSYIRNFVFDKTIDIFINTSDARVYACERNKREVLAQWKNLDECFCDIFVSVKDVKEEYVYSGK